MLDPKFIQYVDEIEFENKVIKKLLLDFCKIKFPSNIHYQKLVYDLKCALRLEDLL